MRPSSASDSAFPLLNEMHTQRGITTREYFAAAALTGLLTRCDDFDQSDIDTAAAMAFRYADAMLRAGRGDVVPAMDARD